MTEPFYARGVFRFVGKDGSLGYRNGKLYYLDVGPGDHPVVIRSATGIDCADGLSPVPYSSDRTFRANWDQVSDDSEGDSA